MSKGPGTVQKRILLLLLGGTSLILASPSPRRYFRTLSQLGREWQRINERSLCSAIRALYESKLIGYRERADGAVTVTLNAAGKQKALTYKVDEMKIPVPARWDRKWRFVLFDIPHEQKRARDALRLHLKRLGFYQFQKSVFVLPYECQNEIEFLIELYDLRPFVRVIEAAHLDNEVHLKDIFNLS